MGRKSREKKKRQLAQKKTKKNLLSWYRGLTGLNRFMVWAGIASIIGVPLAIILFYLSSSSTIIERKVETTIGTINIVQEKQKVSMSQIVDGLNNNAYCNKEAKYCMRVAASDRWYFVKAFRDKNGNSIVDVPHGTVKDDVSIQFLTNDASVVFFSKDTIKGMKLSLWIYVKPSDSRYLDDSLIEEIKKGDQFSGSYVTLIASLVGKEIDFSEATPMTFTQQAISPDSRSAIILATQHIGSIEDVGSLSINYICRVIITDSNKYYAIAVTAGPADTQSERELNWQLREMLDSFTSF